MGHVAQDPPNIVNELWISVHLGGVDVPLKFPALKLLVDPVIMADFVTVFRNRAKVGHID